MNYKYLQHRVGGRGESLTTTSRYLVNKSNNLGVAPPTFYVGYVASFGYLGLLNAAFQSEKKGMAKMDKKQAQSQLNQSRSLGSYDVTKATTKTGWRVRHQSFFEGKRAYKSVPIEAALALGFSSAMNFDQARKHATQLNSQNSIEREKIRNAVTRVQRLRKVNSAFLPDYLVSQFEKHLGERHFGSEDYEKKLLIHWQYIQKLIAQLEIDPKNFFERKSEIYKYFVRRKTSLSYTRKLIKMLNLWGAFVSRLKDAHFEEVPTPRGIQKERINEAYSKSKLNRAGGAIPLTTVALSRLKTDLSDLPGQYEWMHVSLWFGLRPSEINALSDKTKFKIERDPESKVDVLWVYQDKLTAVEKQKRWKGIPIVFPEQQEAISFIKSGNFKQPLNKVLISRTGIERLGAYSGRKGFTDLMLSLDQSLENISVWLGHKSIEMTWAHYKNKRQISFNKTKRMIFAVGNE